MIDRGAHLAAIQKDGLKLIAQDGSEAVVRDIEARDSLNGLERQDLIVLAVKAHFLDAIARQIPDAGRPGNDDHDLSRTAYLGGTFTATADRTTAGG